MSFLSDNNAAISPDGVYRYFLQRSWGNGKKVTFIMLNPSTADEQKDDPTIRRCIGFAKSWGYTGIQVINLYAYRATNPQELSKVKDPVGPENNNWITKVTRDSTLLIAAWGVKADPKRVLQIRELIKKDQSIKALALSKNGIPRHPLYLPKNSVPIDWTFGLQTN